MPSVHDFKPSDICPRELGMLAGVHVGDSLGAPLEFKSRRTKDTWVTDMGVGGFIDRPGEPTDDTELMIAVLCSLTNRLDFSENTCKKNFVTWLESDPKDVGSTTRNGIEAIMRNEKPMVHEWGQGNGSLMRVAPLALLKTSSMKLDATIEAQCTITHPHQNCVLSDMIFVRLLKQALTTNDRQNIWRSAVGLSIGHTDLHDRIRNIPNTQWEQLSPTGFVFDTLVNAVWSIYHFDSFEAAIISVINMGGDADTNGAVAGALNGAFYGIEDIPLRWIRQIEKFNVIKETLNSIRINSL